MSSEPNLRVLKPSRKRLQRGDIFALSPGAGVYLFGRVISTSAVAGSGLRDLNLIYVYDTQRKTPEPPPDPEIGVAGLLLPPMMINRLPWSRGYFETVDHRDLVEASTLATHCFKDSRGRYFDDHGTELLTPVEPVGQRGVHSFRTVDDAVSAALGIPLAP